jgi:undecaprenyl-diphosphatase
VSIADEMKPGAAKQADAPRHWFLANLREGFAFITRGPRATTRPTWRSVAHVVVATVVGLPILLLTMGFVDVPAIHAVAGLPTWVPRLFDKVSEFGTSDWVLVPVGVAVLSLAALARPTITHMTRLVAVTLMVRFSFIFAAVAIPGLIVTVGKRLIGRARPYAGDPNDPFLYFPFSWQPEYASLPSGHATNAFAALIAIGLVWPRLRPVLFVYALLIAAARVLVSAHHVSDVIAGAAAGAVGALLVRDWFAARRLGFAIEPDGSVRTLPGPSWKRLKAAVRQLLSH